MHGCGGMYRRDGSVARRDEAWAREFRDQGYIVLQVDSFGPRGIDSICTRIDRPIQPARERRRDAYGARAYLQGLAGVRADRIGLMGWSNGGSSTLWSVSNSKAAREILPPGPDFRAAIAFYPGCSAALQEPKWMTRVPLYVLIGEKDDWTPAPPCVDLARRTAGFGGPMEIIVYPDSHHGFDAPNTPLSVLGNIAATASGTATISTNPVARADAIRRASNYFARQLKD
ncbi:MAG: dienelactone hydrolase family protein [Rhodospirillales bacterium]|nr:dienelactone hydrolase family protein [Rhodospirillales bacterium]